ncbi:hypothetical protein [Croceicoccus naphthovorans]|uniref:Uncharacterized protein n=1 Tax=Croceicoccus naphthovorans TaxID=1348774 RepID=A0A0G3XFJ2_9SPHN|nr:hypothetical protein [Croceicoccus naphthovorans]AKM09384.1 hypothetical protein AB433_04315 [Croceicoccus naphthovorans]MBB3990311.1 hypothetical protein [Croceicoccus naphthovorans]
MTDFIQTHRRRKDGLKAELLAINGNDVAYRVRFRQGRQTITRITSRDAALFDRDFEAVA